MRSWLRKWWWLTVVGVALILVIGWEQKRGQAQAYDCRAKYAAELAGIEVNQKAAEQQAIAADCEPDGYFYRLFSAANLPTILLVWIGIAGVWAAIRTLRAIENQVDAMVKSERAWVKLDLIPRAVKASDGRYYRRVGSQMVPLTTDEIWEGEWLKYTLKFTNAGRTPAQLISVEVSVGERHERDDSVLWLAEKESFELAEPIVDIERALQDTIKEVGDSAKERNIPVTVTASYRHIFSDGGDVEIIEFRYRYNSASEKMIFIPETRRMDK